MKGIGLRITVVVTLIAVQLLVANRPSLRGSADADLTAPQGIFDHWAYLPISAKNSALLVPIIPDTTSVLDDATGQRLVSVSADGTTYLFDHTTSVLQALAPGKIMVSAPTRLTPDGILRRVTAISANGEQVVVRTQAATLEDAIQQGEALFSERLTPADTKSVKLAPGITLIPDSATQTSSFFVEIKDAVVYDEDHDPATTSDQVVANGSIELEPTVDFRLYIKNWRIEELYFAVVAHETADLEFEVRLKKPLIQTEYRLGDPVQFTRIVVWVGAVPIVLTPVLTFLVGIDGSTHVGLATRVEQVLTATSGAWYAGNKWKPVASFSNSFTFSPPILNAGVDFKGNASCQLQVLVYGVVGPYASVGPFLELEADTSRTPWWELSGGLEVPVGVRADILGYKKIASYEVLAIGAKTVLARAADPPPATPTAASPYQPGNMILVPGGAFQMGCDAEHTGGTACAPGELPLHGVYLDAYMIDRTEVTNGQYAECLAAGQCTATQASSLTRASYFGNPVYVDYPVIAVTWGQAVEYCQWAGKRLPSEAEWEKAARGGADTRAFPWGDDDPTCALVNFVDRLRGVCVGDTSEAGGHPSGASPYGVLDMSGNVWEMCLDWYNEKYYASSPPSNPQGPGSGTQRVLRGGSYARDHWYLASFYRHYIYPGDRYVDVGFRCVRSP